MSPRATEAIRYPVKRGRDKGWLLTRATDEAMNTLIDLREATGLPLTLIMAKALEIGARDLKRTLNPTKAEASAAMKQARENMDAALRRAQDTAAKDYIGINFQPPLTGKVAL